MIASDWKPEFWRPGLPPDDCFRLGHTHVMESPFSKPRVPKDNIDIATDWQSLVRRSNV